MTKKLLYTAFLMFLFGLQAVNAQENSNFENHSLRLSNLPKHAISFQIPVSLTKAGVGVRFSYDYTENVRFTIDGNYYFHSSRRATKYTVDRYDTLNTGTIAWGRRADLNFNANFIFGREQFHIYLIAGFYTTVGYSQAGKIMSTVYDLVTLGEITITEDDFIENTVYLDDGKKYYYKDQLDKFFSFGGGLNVGFGAEYQIDQHNRLYFEQHAAIGSMVGIFIKAGYSWCF